MKRAYATTEAAAVRYLGLRGLESPRAANPIARVERCARCSGGPWTLIGRPGREVAKCASCGQVWDGVLIEGAREPGSGADLDAWQQSVYELVRLRPVFEGRPRHMSPRDWRAHQIAYFGWIHPQLGSLTIVRQAGAHIVPKAPRGWSEDAAHGMVERAERIYEARLRRLRLWSGGPPQYRGGGAWRKPRHKTISPG